MSLYLVVFMNSIRRMCKVGKSAAVDDVIGTFGEDACNRNGNRLIAFLNEVELVIFNGRELPE